jgi:hypothetical protein
VSLDFDGTLGALMGLIGRPLSVSLRGRTDTPLVSLIEGGLGGARPARDVLGDRHEEEALMFVMGNEADVIGGFVLAPSRFERGETTKSGGVIIYLDDFLIVVRPKALEEEGDPLTGT